LNASWGVGLLAGGLILGAWGGFKKQTNTMLMGVICQGIGALLIAFTPPDGLWLAIIGFTLSGIMNSITNGAGFAIYQTVVAPEMQGRVFTVILSMATAISPLALAIGGPLADRIGVRALYFIGGAVLIILAIAGRLTPVVYNLEEQKAKKGMNDEKFGGLYSAVDP
jgi:MFS transporter, DHA3 family, macrolide efflux protein